MSKPIYFANRQMQGFAVSREEILFKGLNRWEGWLCAAGAENLHITADGNAYGATCKVGGILANVYDGYMGFPNNWIKCNKAACACGSDMQIRKVKNAQHKQFAKDVRTKDLTFSETLISDVEAVGPYFDFEPRLTITWDLGRRCNYSCEYCCPWISNNYENPKSKGSLEFAYHNITKQFTKGERTKFIFTGGEPTLNPSYLEFVQRLCADGHIIHTQTNGSMTPDYYSELIKYSFIGISVHLKFVRKERLMKNIEAVIATKRSNPDYQFRWFGLRVMAPPNQVNEAVAIFNEIKSLRAALESDFEVHISAVYQPSDENVLQEYSPGEWELLNQNM